MRIFTFIVFFIGFTAISLHAEKQWTGFDAGFAEAAKSGKPVIIDFYTDWCVWCKRMDKDVFSRNDVSERLAKDFVTIRIDAESNSVITYKGTKTTPRKFTEQMRVQGYPTLIFYDAKGTPLTALPGYVDAKMFMVFLDYVKKGYYSKISFEQYYKNTVK
jgi:thioredoxin-related protein